MFFIFNILLYCFFGGVEPTVYFFTKLGCDDHCTAINVIKFTEKKKKTHNVKKKEREESLLLLTEFLPQG